MFKHPDPFTACNGFVRADYRGAVPMPSLYYQWPYLAHPAYSVPRYYNPAHYTKPHISNSVSSTNAWKHTPVSTHKPSPSSSGSCSSQSFSVSPGQAPGSRDSSSPSRHSSSQSASSDWIQYPSDIALHQELRYHRSWIPTSVGLAWDITRPPSVAKTISPRYIIVNPDFTSPAMHKSVQRFELWPDHPILASYMHNLKWGPVPVAKANPTVLELLEAIYEYLSKALTKDELKFIFSTPQNSQLLERARERRVRDGFDAIYEVAIKGPFKRSDVLGSHRRFLGVRAAKMGDGTDRLHFNIGPGTVSRF